MDKKQQAKNNMNLFLTILQKTMQTVNVALGWDIKNKKLVLKDVETGLISRVELGELNKVLQIEMEE